MNTAMQQAQPFEAEVLQFWANQAQLQRAAFDAFADYLANVRHTRLNPAQDHFGRHSH